MADLPELRVIRAIATRHLPPSLRLESIELCAPDPGNPAPLKVAIVVQRVTDDPDPGGWGYALATEIRAGWPADEWALSVRELPRLPELA